MSREKGPAESAHENPVEDAMSGYASADVFGEDGSEAQNRDPGRADQAQDPMSGYASADEINPAGD